MSVTELTERTDEQELSPPVPYVRESTADEAVSNTETLENTVSENDEKEYESEQTYTDEDYLSILEDDLAQIKNNIPTPDNFNSVIQLKNPQRYGELRDMGLSATEAYLASGGCKTVKDTRSHLTPTVPASAGYGIQMPRAEYEIARELFTDMSESELRKLYRKVTQ